MTVVDVPRALPPSDAERLAILRSHGFPGNLAGESRNVGNPISRDDLAAAGVGGGSEGSLDEIDFKVDLFTVTDDATDKFELTFDPIDDSWNVGMGWPWDENSEFSISGQVLTVLDPTSLFRGIAANGPRTLRVEYAYLTGVPASPTTVIVAFEATGWKYLQVGIGDSTNRSGTGFDDSAWATGQAGFGVDTSTGFSLVFPVNTAWANNSRLWLRRTVPEGSSYEVSVRVDDSCILYWNGTQFATAAGASTSESAASAGPFSVPSGLVTSGVQVFAARFEDGAVGPGGGIALADVQITGDLA